MDKNALALVPALYTLYGIGTASIFDDSDPCYHSDALTGETPAKARKAEASLAKTVKPSRKAA